MAAALMQFTPDWWARGSTSSGRRAGLRPWSAAELLCSTGAGSPWSDAASPKNSCCVEFTRGRRGWALLSRQDADRCLRLPPSLPFPPAGREAEPGCWPRGSQEGGSGWAGRAVPSRYARNASTTAPTSQTRMVPLDVPPSTRQLPSPGPRSLQAPACGHASVAADASACGHASVTPDAPAAESSAPAGGARLKDGSTAMERTRPWLACRRATWYLRTEAQATAPGTGPHKA